MTRRLFDMRPRCWNWRKIGVGLGVLGGLGAAFFCGRYIAPPTAMALPPLPGMNREKTPERPAPAPVPTPSTADSARRPVAYIYGTTMISREDLGEYLIARDGATKLQFLVNRRIIEHGCKQRGVTVTSAEVDAALKNDLNDLHLDLKSFNERLLKHYRKTLYEWKEDVIWPKLALTKLARDRIKVEAADLQAAFDAYHGEKVDGRLILFKPEEEQMVLNKIWPEIRNNEEAFITWAKQQATPSLAARAGKLEKPIGRHTTGDDDMEREFFSLKPGEVSTVLKRPEGIVVFRCERKIPAETNVTLESVREKLEKEIIEKKIQFELPRVFEALKAEAKPTLFIKSTETQEDLDRDVKPEIEALNTPGKMTSPSGN